MGRDRDKAETGLGQVWDETGTGPRQDPEQDWDGTETGSGTGLGQVRDRTQDRPRTGPGQDWDGTGTRTGLGRDRDKTGT